MFQGLHQPNDILKLSNRQSELFFGDEIHQGRKTNREAGDIFPEYYLCLLYTSGRELRVIVGADKMNDEESIKLSDEIATKIQNEMTYPGQVKICLLYTSDKEILYMALIDVALRYEKESDRNDTKPYDDILEKLTSEIEDALK